MDKLINSRDHYGTVAVALHWLMAILIMFMLLLGLYMADLPDLGFNNYKITLILIHKEIGVLVLMLVILRLVWRWLNKQPALPSNVPLWQSVLAKTIYFLFYCLMFAMPITGWLMSSAAGLPLSFLGVLHLPMLLSENQFVTKQLIEIHKITAFVLLGLLLLHIVAALRHHFYLKDKVLKRMLF